MLALQATYLQEGWRYKQDLDHVLLSDASPQIVLSTLCKIKVYKKQSLQQAKLPLLQELLQFVYFEGTNLPSIGRV